MWNKEENFDIQWKIDECTTCTFNPDIAAKLIEVKTSLSEGLKIVEIAKETKKKHRTEIYANYCSGMPRYPVLTEPLKGETDEVRSERRKKRRKYLNAAWELLENEEAIKENRKRRILKGWNEWLKLQKSINIINFLKTSSPLSPKLCDMDKKK